MKRIHSTIECTPAGVDSVAEALREVCRDLGFSEVDAYQIELAACEAMVNVIRHAYQGQPGTTMTVDAAVEDGRLVVEILDKGTPMPADRVRDLTEGASTPAMEGRLRSSLPESGRGLQIIHDVMDEISYDTEGGVNRLRMGKLLGSRQNPSA